MTRIKGTPRRPLTHENAPLFLFMDWLAARFEKGGDYAAFRLNGLTVVVAASDVTAAALEGLVRDYGGSLQEVPAGRSDDPRGDEVAS